MKNFTLFLLFFSQLIVVAGTKMTPEEYIEKYKEIAIKEMKRTGIPASITLAQGLLESGNGNSSLVKEANNHFGIKCHSGWEGKTYLKDDDEKNDCFRKYDSDSESFKDHSEFLSTRSRYAFLFEYESTDYKSWAYGLKQAGYATNPKYPELLISLIEKYQLYQYDQKVKKSIHDGKEKVREKGGEKSDEIQLVISRVILSENFIKSIIVKEGEKITDIAKITGVSVKRLLKYNEKTNEEIQVGEILYLQPKRKSAREKFHTVENKETLLSIAHKYGVSTKSIRKRNLMTPDEEVKVGQKLKLKGRKIKPEEKAKI